MSNHPSSLETCFQQGADARAAGRRCADNPYRRDTDEWREWHAGWSATFDLDEEDDPASNRLRKEDDVDCD